MPVGFLQGGAWEVFRVFREVFREVVVEPVLADNLQEPGLPEESLLKPEIQVLRVISS
jgi:hypothetical protein